MDPLIGIWEVVFEFARVILCCGDAELSISRARSTTGSHPRILIHSQGSLNPEEMQMLVKRQIAFRSTREVSRKKRAEVRRLSLVGEGVEDPTRWLRLAAVIVMQTCAKTTVERRRSPCIKL